MKHQKRSSFQYLSISYECALAIGNSLNLPEMLHEVIHKMVHKTNAHHGIIWVRNESQELQPLASAGINIRDVLAQDEIMDIRNGLNQIQKSRQFVLRHKNDNDFLQYCPVLTEKEESVLIVPVANVAIVHLVYANKEIADEPLANLLAGLSKKLSVAIEACMAYKNIINEVQVRVEAESELKQSEARLRQVIDTIPHMVFAKDRDGRFIMANKAVADGCGTTPENMVGKTHPELLGATPEQYESYLIDDREVIDSGKLKFIPEEDYTHPDGHKVIMETTKIPFTSAGIPAVLGVSIDITERKQAEEALRCSEDQFRIIAENTSDLITLQTFDLKASYNYVSPSIKTIAGYEPEELLGKSCFDFIHPDDKKNLLFPLLKKYVNKKIKKLLTGKESDVIETIEFRIKNKSGNWLYAETTSNVAGKQLLCVTRDITERKQAEEKIQHLNLVLRTIRNVNQLIVEEKNKDVLIQKVCEILIKDRGYSNAWLVLLGEQGEYINSAEAGLGKNFIPMRKMLEEGKLTICGNDALIKNDLVITKDPKKECLGCPLYANYSGQSGYTICIKHGDNIYGLLSVSASKYYLNDEEEQGLFKEVAGDIGFALHNIEVKGKQKQAEKELKKYRNHLERLVKVRTIELDITNKKLEATNNELEAFSYSVSHDLRAPLRHIDGFTKLLNKNIKSKIDEKSQNYFDNIISSSKQMNQLIDDLLIFSRMGKADVNKFNINMKTVVDEALQTFDPDIKKNKISIVVDDMPDVHLDVSLIKQAWVNLISNAIKFTGNKEKPEIHIGTDKDRDGNTLFFIKDNGVGFDQKYVDKMFGVFQRLHSINEFPGTGIGLANVKRIIMKHGGDISAKGKINKGASFFFTLPDT